MIAENGYKDATGAYIHENDTNLRQFRPGPLFLAPPVEYAADAPASVERFLLLRVQAVIKDGGDQACRSEGSRAQASGFSANAIRPGVVERSVLSAHSDVFAEASADAEASLKSFSAVFWGSVRLSRFARRSVLGAGVTLLLQIALIILVSSHVP